MSLVEEVEKLQKKVSVESAAQRGIKQDLMKLKGSVTASDELPERWTESDKTFEAIRTEVMLLKEQL